MRYAIEVLSGYETRLTEVIHIPDPLPDWAENVEAFLAIQCPTQTGFIQVADDNVNGAVKQEDGTYLNPSIQEPPSKFKVLSKLEFIELAQMAGGMTDDMLVAAQDDPALRVLWIKFDHCDILQYEHPLVAPGLDALVVTGYMPNGRDAVMTNWPKE